MTDIVDQPKPVFHPGRPISWELVIADMTKTDRYVLPVIGTHAQVVQDMRDRDALGRERYGTPLQPFNGRRQLVDAYQEKLDYVVYLRSWLEENVELRDTDGYRWVADEYEGGLGSLQHLRHVINQETAGRGMR